MDRFVAFRIKWLQYDFRDGLVKCPSISNGLFFQNNNFIEIRRKTCSVKGERNVISSCMISVMIASKLLRKGCMAYLAYALR